jgi:HdeA/HdeB family
VLEFSKTSGHLARAGEAAFIGLRHIGDVAFFSGLKTMIRQLGLMCAAYAAFAALFIAPAAAETIDVSTQSCDEFSKEKSITMLYWMAGYHATQDQGTVVDNAKLKAAVDQTISYCAEHPALSVLTVSEKFMGAHMGEPGPESIDVATVTCSDFLDDKADKYKNTLIWLTGYHASSNEDSTLIEMESFMENMGKIGTYCAKHPKVGLLTASEKFLTEEE